MQARFFGIATVLLVGRLAVAAEGPAGKRLETDSGNGSAQGTDLCDFNARLYFEANRFYDARRFDEALSMAGQVRLDSKCELPYLQSRGLRATILVLELKDYEKGLLAAGEGLAVDPRQKTLWFLQGQAHFALEHYREAIASFQEVFQSSPGSIPEATLIEARYLMAESTDRLAMQHQKDLPTDASAGDALQGAVRSWLELQDFCRDRTCPRDKLNRAAQRLEELRALGAAVPSPR